MIQTWLLFCMVYLKVQSLILLFFIYINDVNQAIRFCKVYYFADDTNLFPFSKSITKPNKCINLNIKNLTDLLNANKISLIVQKTPKKEDEVKIKFSSRRLYPTDFVKYFNIRIDENLNWKQLETCF